MTILTVILAILAFGCLVIVHEFGHFMAAKAAGVHVLEFWVGMGPSFAHKKIGETDFKLCILPFGGACVMEGEDTEQDQPHAGGCADWLARADSCCRCADEFSAGISHCAHSSAAAD